MDFVNFGAVFRPLSNGARIQGAKRKRGEERRGSDGKEGRKRDKEEGRKGDRNKKRKGIKYD